MVEVRRKKGESFEAFMRRYRTVLKLSGRLLQAKKVQFYARPKNKTAAKKSALARLNMARKRAYLLKTGQLTEDDEQQKHSRR